MIMNFRKIEKQMFRAEWEDGLKEMVNGVSFLICAFVFLFFDNPFLSGSEEKTGSMFWAPYLFAFAVGLLNKWSIHVLRRKWTYPRTGFVSLRRPKNYVGFVMGAFILSRLAASRFRYMPGFETDLIYIGFSGVFFYIYYFLRTGLIRFVGFVMISLAAGVILAKFGPAGDRGFSIFLSVIGVISFISGAIVFFKFIKKNPVVEDRPS
jgi:hypothetical protein